MIALLALMIFLEYGPGIDVPWFMYAIFGVNWLARVGIDLTNAQ